MRKVMALLLCGAMLPVGAVVTDARSGELEPDAPAKAAKSDKTDPTDMGENTKAPTQTETDDNGGKPAKADKAEQANEIENNARPAQPEREDNQPRTYACNAVANAEGVPGDILTYSADTPIGAYDQEAITEVAGLHRRRRRQNAAANIEANQGRNRARATAKGEEDTV